MPAGSLQTNLADLQNALSGVTQLKGSAGDENTAPSGFSGAASLSSTAELTDTFGGLYSGKARDIFSFNGQTDIDNVSGFFSQIQSQLQAPPDTATSSFGQNLEQTRTQQADTQRTIQQGLTDLRRLLEELPTNPSAIASILVDQLLKILAKINGPEARQITAWVQAVEEQVRLLAPLLEELNNTSNPVEVVVLIFEKALQSILKILGYEPVQKLIDDMGVLAENAFPSTLITDVNQTLDTLDASLDTLCIQANSGFIGFRSHIDQTATHFNAVIDDSQTVMRTLRQFTEMELFQPGALEGFLREKLQAVLELKINETQKIDDPFNALFDKLDESVEAVDFSSVSDEVTDFFEQINTMLENMNGFDVNALFGESLDNLEQGVNTLQAGVNQLLGDVQTHFNQLSEQAHELAQEVGSFDAEGVFHFHFEAELKTTLGQAQHAIAGNPDDPNVSSLASYLNDFESTLSGFIQQIQQLLDPVNTTINDIKDDAVSAIDEFSDFMTGLNIPDLIEELAIKVDEILDALLPIDIAQITDPVIDELNKAEQSLAGIDPNDLNEILREALKVALDIVISIDFSTEISRPIDNVFQQAQAETNSGIEQLQRRYEESLEILEQLNPNELLNTLFEAYDIIKNQTDVLDLNHLLKPLDDLHKEYLQEPLDKLRPSILLQPVSDAYHENVDVLDQVNGEALLAPLVQSLDSFKQDVRDFDAVAPLNEIKDVIDEIKKRIESFSPVAIMQPLDAEFSRLEAELDIFKPSVLFAPITVLATPLLEVLDNVQQDTVDALHQAYQAPLALLAALQPDKIKELLEQQIDSAIQALDQIALDRRINTMKAKLFDVRGCVEDDIRMQDLLEMIDIQSFLGEISITYTRLRATLVSIKESLDYSGLLELYDEVHQRLMGMLPAYARATLDPETFRRLMRRADPRRFLTELDGRFMNIKNRIIPLRPSDIADELEQNYQNVLTQINRLDPSESIDRLILQVTRLKQLVELIRIDFLAEDIDQVVDELRTVLNGFDVANLFPELDALHDEVVNIVVATQPSSLLTEAQGSIDEVKQLVDNLDPRTVLGEPLNNAWVAVEDSLDAIDFTVILAPLVLKIQAINVDFTVNLKATEDGFDAMLRSANQALGSGAQSSQIGGAI